MTTSAGEDQYEPDQYDQPETDCEKSLGRLNTFPDQGEQGQAIKAAIQVSGLAIAQNSLEAMKKNVSTRITRPASTYLFKA